MNCQINLIWHYCYNSDSTYCKEIIYFRKITVHNILKHIIMFSFHMNKYYTLWKESNNLLLAHSNSHCQKMYKKSTLSIHALRKALTFTEWVPQGVRRHHLRVRGVVGISHQLVCDGGAVSSEPENAPNNQT